MDYRAGVFAQDSGMVANNVHAFWPHAVFTSLKLVTNADSHHGLMIIA